MKKVLVVFLALVLLSQAVKFWARGHEAASLNRHSPIKLHKHPDNGSNPGKASVLIALNS
jgi:hypothetical protein